MFEYKDKSGKQLVWILAEGGDNKSSMLLNKKGKMVTHPQQKLAVFAQYCLGLYASSCPSQESFGSFLNKVSLPQLGALS